ncbi:MAG TPA: adenosine deaminase family protein [Lentisphaeria bacterium]|nr:MAG: adenosine deaminase [Lentisphaerae bacterium GWF2_38_69]HBM17566.1 adenosine deaminase family protein [Lentisphaeria bacterium]
MLEKMRNFIREIPKTDLHVHLDGSLRLETLIELAKQEKVKLPSYEESGLRELVFKEKYSSLGDYLKGFAYTCAVLQNKENLERVAYELAIDNIAENVRYLEVRFAPQLHQSQTLSLPEIIGAVNNGLERARLEHKLSPGSTSGKDIPFRYGIIVGAMRCFNEYFSSYYSDLFKIMSHAPKKEVFKAASMELARAAVKIRDDHNYAIVGFDLCGEEHGYPAILHKDAYTYVHKNFMGKTVHAGEAYGPESIFQAITDCHANRIGHGTFLFEHTEIKDPDIVHPEKFADALSNYIAGRRISIEVCPTSNLQTLPHLKNDIRNHPIKKMIDKRLSVSICTDNRLVSNTTVTKELSLIVENFDLTPKQFRDLVIAGFKGSFFYSCYVDQRKFVREAIDRYDSLAKEFFS